LAAYHRGCSEAQLYFEGATGQWKIALAGARMSSWRLSMRRQADETLVPQSAPLADVTLRGRNTIVFQRPGRLLVVNDVFSPAWKANTTDALHLRTALGTNAWILPANSGPVEIEYSLSRAFHVTYWIGLAVIVIELLAIVLPWNWRPTRAP
jgi:hypothetical protein